MTDSELQAIRERAARATPGPWRTSTLKSYVIPPWGYKYKVAQLGGSEELPGVIARSDEYLPHDTDFVAHARQDIPALLAEVDRLRNIIRCGYIVASTSTRQ